MGLFSKKDEVPRLPQAPEIPEIPGIDNSSKTLPELPSFPSENYQQEAFNQEMVKSAVADREESILPEIPQQIEQESYSSGDNEVVVEPPRGGIDYNVEERSMIPSLPQKPIEREERRRTLEISKPQERLVPTIKENEPVFVRIDKFQTAQKDFAEIKKRTKEIEAVLRKLKNTKEKEEKEIDSWTEGLEKIKARLSEIDQNIFDKL